MASEGNVLRSSSVLIWPTVSTVTLELREAGYVVGWEDVHVENGTQTYSEPRQGPDSNGRDVNTRRTTICAGVIPLECSIGNETFSVQENHVRGVLERWSSQYNCRGQNDSTKDCVKCPCITCSCHGSLQIVGVWEPNGNGLKQQSPLLRLVPKAQGPWWEEDPSSETRRQLLLYDSCKGLSYYRQDANWYPSLLDSSSIVGFQKTLVRISEAQGLFQSFHKALMSELPTFNDIMGDSIGYEEQLKEREESSDDSGSSSIGPNREAETSGKGVNPNESTIGERLKHSIVRNSLFLKHWGQGSHEPGIQKEISRVLCIRRFPLLHFLWLLRNHGVADSSSLVLDHSNGFYIPSELASKSVVGYSELLAGSAVDGVLGVVSGTVLMYYVDPLLACLGKMWDVFHNRMLRDNIGWLETFPVGFKLNVPLTRNMGGEVNMLVSAHDWISRECLSENAKRWFLILIGSVGVVFGFLTFLAVVFDVTRMATIHVAVFATCFKKMHRAQLYMLSSLWRLFRGKKRNILRHRTDTMEYDSIQLLLGVLLFAIVLFLFTTVLVYYTFFTVLNLAIICVMVAVWALYVMVRLFPLGKCLLRMSYPGWFTRDVYIEELLSVETEDLCILVGPEAIHGVSNQNVASEHCRSITKLTAMPKTFSAIISEALLRPFVSLVSGIPSFLLEFIGGSPCTILQRCQDSVDSIARNRQPT